MSNPTIREFEHWCPDNDCTGELLKTGPLGRLLRRWCVVLPRERYVERRLFPSLEAAQSWLEAEWRPGI